MKTATLFIFLILLLGLILALFLGSRYQEGLESTKDTKDDKDKDKGTKDTSFDLSKIGIFGASLFPKSSGSSSSYENSSLSVGTSLYGAHGEMIVVKTDKLGNNYLEMTKTRTSDSVILELDPHDSKTYIGPRDARATVFTVNKQPALKVFDSDGNITMYTIDGVRSNLNDSLEDDDDNDTSSSWWSRSKSKSKSKSRSMSEGRDTKDKNEYTRVNHDTTLSPSTGTGTGTGAGLGAGTGVGGFVDSLFNKNSNTNTNAPSMSSASNQSVYSNSSLSLPSGIPANQIPRGQEDLYVLKSQIVPPVCPTCPTCPAFSPATSSSSKSMTTTSMMPATAPPKETCPPCPSCARCPEPSFECKKVPNYNAMNNEFLPIPVLNDFSSFGM